MYFVLNVASLWKNYNAKDTVEKALEDAEEWDQRLGNEETMQTDGHQVPQATEVVRWKPPPREWVKCNTDGAWNGADNHCGTRWVLQNDSGDVLWAGAQAVRCARSMLEVELEAMRGAMSSMVRLSYTKVIFESDSLGMVNLLNSGEVWPAFAPMLQEMYGLLSLFQKVQIVYAPRVCNSVADRVARESLSLGNYDPKLYSRMSLWVNHLVLVDKQCVQ
ncbi:PREDICTED: uncharacterized protein LOC109132595 [Camelina sativa]|uniref:Uncharacterized protein LOC109132595 n=1 Tax=Camelina sativa TaxID=90675 RepID=A0ABM1RLK7_CAMSA|nr:PREDICTED: uncharacterized protein LOC109132595 [Camelina sativa]